jgi:hypothetical protein
VREPKFSEWPVIPGFLFSGMALEVPPERNDDFRLYSENLNEIPNKGLLSSAR